MLRKKTGAANRSTRPSPVLSRVAGTKVDRRSFLRGSGLAVGGLAAFSAGHLFRYDPATDNGGWHDSASYPVEVDNPLNGNMYKPLYFNDDGQAILLEGDPVGRPAQSGLPDRTRRHLW